MVEGVSRPTVAYRPFFMYLVTLPTGNCNPALADLLFALVLPFPFPPFRDPFLAGIFRKGIGIG